MNNNEVNKTIENFISDYNQNKEPIRINFRSLVPELNNSERYTHLIHSYPAKLLCNIPYFFLKTDFFCPSHGVVLDPFCGTGTVLLEANISGRHSVGADANPLAILISKVKTTYISEIDLNETLLVIISKASKLNTENVLENPSVLKWFSKSTLIVLNRLELVISEINDEKQRNFFMLCFSSLIKKVSFADPSISVPVRLNPDRFNGNLKRKQTVIQKIESLKDVNIIEKFQQICQINIRRIQSLKEIDQKGLFSTVISNDARRLTTSLNSNTIIKDCSIDFIITSPPYAGAQKYIRSSWLNLYWLGTKDSADIRKLKNQNIGREDYLKSDIHDVKTGIDAADKILSDLFSEGKKERAYIVGNYLNEMKDALDESIRVLKNNSYMVIIIGNNTVCGRPFDTQDYITTYIESKGLTLQFKLIDDIKSYGLMTKRNKTASRISCEWVLVFKKL